MSLVSVTSPISCIKALGLDRHISDSGRKYVLVTPVKNEGRTIQRTLDSVARQEELPAEWIIVDDGSTDETHRILAAYARAHRWIHTISLPAGTRRSFAVVVENTQLGIRKLLTKDYDFLGLLDGDVEFACDYFSRVMDEFAANPNLGIAGGAVIDVGSRIYRLPRNKKDIPGAVQFFSRSCLEAIGSFTPIPEGGWDALTCAVARMHGFQTRLLDHLIVDHLKPRNFHNGGVVRRNWQLGTRDFALGYDPLFEFLKCISRVTQEPFLSGSLAWWWGYVWASITRRRRIVDMAIINHIRSEQRQRMLGVALKVLTFWPRNVNSNFENTDFPQTKTKPTSSVSSNGR